MTGRIVPAVFGHQDGSVRIDSKKVRCPLDPVYLSFTEMWQTGFAEALLLTQRRYPFDHHLGIVTGFRENRMPEPAHLLMR